MHILVKQDQLRVMQAMGSYPVPRVDGPANSVGSSGNARAEVHLGRAISCNYNPPILLPAACLFIKIESNIFSFPKIDVRNLF